MHRIAAMPVTIALLLAATLGGEEASRQAFDDLWPRRDEPSAAAALEAYATAFTAGSDYGELWRAAGWYVWLATGDVSGSAVKRYALQGLRAGEKALALEPAGVEAKYWTALSLGLYASAIAPLDALALNLGRGFRDPLVAVMRADPTCTNASVEYVGAELALGAMFQHLPWPARDVGRARTLFEAALEAHPENLRARFLLADLTKDENPDEARRQLERVVAGDEAYDPPDARRIKHRALALLEGLGQGVGAGP
jgi:hypothetical protein